MNLIPYVKACYPVLYLVTPEESRAETMILNTCKELKRNLKVWSHTEGFISPLDPKAENRPGMEDPVGALDAAKGEKPGTIIVMRDLHQFLTIPKTIRQMRDIARDFKQTQKTLVIISPVKKIPPELERDVTVLEFDLPTKEDLNQIWKALYEGNKKKIGEISEDEQERIVQASMGLTTIEAEAAFSKAVVENATNGTKDTPISILVMKEKANAVKKSGILEYFEAKQTSNDIGGLENLKSWLEMRSRAFSKQAREFGLPMPRGILLVGLPGCIAEGTEIVYKRGKRCSGRTLKIEELYAKFHNIKKGNGGGPSWDQSIPTLAQSWDPETERMIFAEISNVVKKGEKPCIRITTDIAGSVELTKDHPVLTASGEFCEAGDLSVGSKLLVRGSMLPQPGAKKKRIRATNRVSLDSLPIWYKSGSIKKVTVDGKTYTYKRQRKARLVIEAHMNGMSLDEYLEVLRSGPEEAGSLKVLSSKFDVHHVDEDPSNDNISNLMVMLTSKHKDLHHHHDESKFNIEYVKEATVTKIVDAGIHETFDISIREPGPHNFSTASGIILHNCGKSLSAKAASNILGVPLIRFDIGRVFGGLVGESESNMRSAIQTAEAVGSCVLWIDEMEKAFAGMGGSGSTDGGTSQRVFGNFITWMQEKTTPCFIISTVNRIETLPPELLRKGRFDETFFVGLPSETERKAIIGIHIKKYGRDISNFDSKVLDKCVKDSKGFSGAELEEAVVTGLYAAFHQNRDLSAEDIHRAIKETNPLSKSKEDELKAMANWAKSNALNASRVVEEKAAEQQAGRQLEI